MNDTRNVVDQFKGMAEVDIVAELDKHGTELEIAIENLERDFNMGTIVRSANAFGVRHVHVIGRKQWNKRGAMATDKYLHVHYYQTVESFKHRMQDEEVEIVAIDNVKGAITLNKAALPKRCVLVFGAEGPGLSEDMLKVATQIVAIEQYGSTRSINVGVAAGVAMYAWLQKHKL